MDPKAEIYPRGSKQQNIVHAVALISAVLAVLSAVVVVYVLCDHSLHGQGIVAGLAAFWLIWPPLWFFYEYFRLYRTVAVPDSFEMFKHGQQVSVAIWAGISLTLTGLAASDFVRPTEATLICKPMTNSGNTPDVFDCRRKSNDNGK
jgi:hypothetical protein